MWNRGFPAPYGFRSSSGVPTHGAFEGLRTLVALDGGSSRGQFDVLRAQLAAEQRPGESSAGSLDMLKRLNDLNDLAEREEAAVYASYDPGALRTPRHQAYDLRQQQQQQQQQPRRHLFEPRQQQQQQPYDVRAFPYEQQQQAYEQQQQQQQAYELLNRQPQQQYELLRELSSSDALRRQRQQQQPDSSSSSSFLSQLLPEQLGSNAAPWQTSEEAQDLSLVSTQQRGS